MRAALWLLGLFGAAVAAALFAGNNQGTVTLYWPPYRIALSLNMVVLLLVGGFVTVHAALRALAALLELPHQARRWRVQQKERAMHGALLDAEILAEVYVAMTRGQESLIMDLENNSAEQQAINQQALADRPRREQRIVRASDDELAEHAALLAAIQKESKGQCLWLTDETAPQP